MWLLLVGKKPSPLPLSPDRRGLAGAMHLLEQGLPSAGSGGSRKLHNSSVWRPRDFGGESDFYRNKGDFLLGQVLWK